MAFATKYSTSNYKKTHKSITIGGQQIVDNLWVMAAKLGTVIETEDGFFQVTGLLRRSAPIAPLYVAYGVKVSAKKAAAIKAVHNLKLDIELLASNMPAFNGMADRNAEIWAVRGQIDEVKAELAKWDECKDIVAADVYCNGRNGDNGSTPMWMRETHLISR